MRSSHQKSRSGFQAIGNRSAPTRRATMQLWTRTPRPALSSIARSAFSFNRITLSPRNPPSVVMTVPQAESTIQSASESALNPPNTTEWIAPIRAQARMAMASSGIIGM